VRSSRLAALGARSDTYSADICSLRLLAHFQSEHPRLDCLPAGKGEWMAPSSRLAFRFGGSHPMEALHPGGERALEALSSSTAQA
jgi:hypothetical protein